VGVWVGKQVWVGVQIIVSTLSFYAAFGRL